MEKQEIIQGEFDCNSTIDEKKKLQLQAATSSTAEKKIQLPEPEFRYRIGQRIRKQNSEN